jgi:5-hydroxyisourate hydrolase
MSVSTHVLDTSSGRPAPGVPVRLEARVGTGWREVDRGVTDADGRIAGWPAGDGGVHRLVFDLTGYHGPAGFYPEVVVVFRITEPTEHYHVPLLLSPFGYTTYRGS